MSSYIDRLKIHKDRIKKICRSDVRSVDKGADSRGKAAYFIGFDDICDKFCFLGAIIIKYDFRKDLTTFCS